MKRTFFILPVAITLLFGFVSCNDSKNEEEKQDLKYSVNFSEEECEQKLNEWKAKKPKKYSFTCYCDDGDFWGIQNYALAKITVTEEESSIKYYKSFFYIDKDDNYQLDVSDEEADYKLPEKGDLFYITCLDDVFEKAMNIYSKHKDKIESKSYAVTYVDSHYDKNYSFVNDFCFQVSTFDYSGLDFDDGENTEHYMSEFFVYITDFKVLEN